MEDILFFNETEEFINWLEQNHKIERELWVGFYKVKSKNSSITWSESVDCAIAFGWIDGVRKSIDEESYKIRFTPRNVKSVWSKVNVEKVHRLIELGKMRPEGLVLFNQRQDKEGYSAENRAITLAKEYEEVLRADAKVWDAFNKLPPAYKRDTVWSIMTAKKEETRLRRLHKLIDELSSSNKT